ncbi:MAG: hypothetical protein HC889_08210 [Synechococcaceae cyanobacterium SM1_2_3]|nr:hypothetical protein [Synechococcaceae cyanobacterium SM1_2_3]
MQANIPMINDLLKQAALVAAIVIFAIPALAQQKPPETPPIPVKVATVTAENAEG